MLDCQSVEGLNILYQNAESIFKDNATLTNELDKMHTNSSYYSTYNIRSILERLKYKDYILAEQNHYIIITHTGSGDKCSVAKHIKDSHDIQIINAKKTTTWEYNKIYIDRNINHILLGIVWKNSTYLPKSYIFMIITIIYDNKSFYYSPKRTLT